MNLDELKSTWNQEKTNNVHIPTHINDLRKATHPLDKLKRNMKNEWYLQLIAIVLLGFIPQIQGLHSSLHLFYYIAYGFLVIISAYYLTTFKLFYSRITHYSENTKDSLTSIYHAFRLNIERYHSFAFILLPFCLTWMGIYIYNDLLEKGKTWSAISEANKMALIAIVIVLIVLFILAVFGWTKYYYGKYLKQLKHALDELKSDEN